MKFSALQENLKTGLGFVGHVAGKNVNLPVLNNVLIEARDGKIKFTTTNLEIGISSVVRGKIEADGVFTVDAKILTDYVNLLPNQRVDLVLDGARLSVECDDYKTKINGQSAEDFPLIPQVDRTAVCKIRAEELKKALAQVVFAAATSETRLELAGVLFLFNTKELILAATDSFRLTEKKLKNLSLDNSLANKRFIIPIKTLQEVIRVLSGGRDGESGDEVEIYFSENQVLFVYGTTELVSRLIEGNYPDYQQIVPTQTKTKAIVKIDELMRAVKASSLFSKTGINDVNLDFPKNKAKMMISAASGQSGENMAEVEAKISGEDNFVVLNYRYLLDGLNNLGEPSAVVMMVDGNTPCIIRPELDDSYLYIIMPIKQ
jgi:DNA polymerase-3 subunit beta